MAYANRHGGENGGIVSAANIVIAGIESIGQRNGWRMAAGMRQCEMSAETEIWRNENGGMARRESLNGNGVMALINGSSEWRRK